MVSLISVHGRGSLSDVYGLLHFSLVPVGFTGQYVCVLQDSYGVLKILKRLEFDWTKFKALKSLNFSKYP